MALDGIFLRALKDELSEALFEARIDKIYQPTRDDIVFTWRQRGGFDGVKEKFNLGSGGFKTLLSARANSPRVHVTALNLENPTTPPMFCMVLRKHLMGARLIEIRQDGLERALYFDFSAVNEMGDIVNLTLAVEIMGRHSNIILFDEDNRVIDSIKRVPPDKSSVRPILPGVTYSLPPKGDDKFDFSEVEADEIDGLLSKVCLKCEPLDKALLDTVLGISPLICREIAYLALGENYREILAVHLNDEQKDKLKSALIKVKNKIETQSKRVPYLILNGEEKPIEYSFMPITQYGLDGLGREISSFSSLLDEYYSKRDIIDRMRQISIDVNQVVNNAVNRLTKKLNSQKLELEKSIDREKHKIFGDLIYANTYLIEKGASSVSVQNYYDDNAAEVTIPLDKRLNASQNAQAYFKKYRKAVNAEAVLKEQITLGSEELEYLKSVQDALSRCTTSSEIEQMREELIESGYLRRRGAKINKAGKVGKPPKANSKKSDFLEFITPDGFEILVGKNNIQNDKLTLKTAGKKDLWFHTKDLPGSHTVLFTRGEPATDIAIETAAMIAAFHSKGAESSGVPVDYAEIKNVRKPSGAKPGMVIYDNNRTIYITPDAKKVEGFKKSKS